MAKISDLDPRHHRSLITHRWPGWMPKGPSMVSSPLHSPSGTKQRHPCRCGLEVLSLANDTAPIPPTPERQQAFSLSPPIDRFAPASPSLLKPNKRARERHRLIFLLANPVEHPHASRQRRLLLPYLLGARVRPHICRWKSCRSPDLLLPDR